MFFGELSLDVPLKQLRQRNHIKEVAPALALCATGQRISHFSCWNEKPFSKLDIQMAFRFVTKVGNRHRLKRFAYGKCRCASLVKSDLISCFLVDIYLWPALQAFSSNQTAKVVFNEIYFKTWRQNTPDRWAADIALALQRVPPKSSQTASCTTAANWSHSYSHKHLI